MRGNLVSTWRQLRRHQQTKAVRESPQEGPGGECRAFAWPYVNCYREQGRKGSLVIQRRSTRHPLLYGGQLGGAGRKRGRFDRSIRGTGGAADWG